MLWQWSPGVIAELIAAAIMLVLAIYFPWRDLNRQARLTGVTLVFFCALWILSHAIEIGLPVAAYKESLVGLQLILGIMALTFWLFYIFHYFGPRKLLTWRIYILFGIMPLIAILALSTNNVYGLMWTGVGLDSQNPYLPLQPTYGIIYWACMAYIAMLTLTGSLLIIWNIIRRRGSYSRESIYLLIAAVIPLITAFIEVMGLLSFLKLSVGLSSWTACIGAIILILNLPRFHLEQVIPVARDIIFERIGDCILVLDNQNRVLDLNPAAEQLTGYRISDAFGLSIEQIWPHHSTSMISFNKMAEAGEKLVLERDGEKRVYDLHISTTTGSNGRVTSQVVLLSDITERKQAEESLRASEEKYRVLVENINDALLILDTQGNITYISPSVERFTKYKASDLIGKPFTQVIHPDDLTGLLASFNRLASGQLEPWEFRVLDKDGKIIFTRTSSRPIYEDGQIVGFTTLLTDITESRQAEEKLRESEEQFRTSLENGPDAVYMNDLEGNFFYGNLKCEEIIGYKREELKGKSFLKLNILTENSLTRAAEILRDNINGKSTGPDELEIIRKDGRRVPVEINTGVIRSKGRAVVLAFVREITERKLAEEKLLRSYESLQKTLNDALNTMVMILEMRDPYTAGHQQRVADLATAIARAMKFEDARIEQLRMAAIIHDIGKMYVPSDILSKPGKLSDIEFSLIKTHSQCGYDIVKGMDFPCSVAKVVLQHHERLDGSGYPNQLKSADMLIEAKILAVADVIEAMASHRPYRPALGIARALEEISSNKGKLYDPEVVDTCLELFNSGKFEFKSV